MMKYIIVIMALCFAAGSALADQCGSDSMKPVSTVVKDAGVVVKKAAVGTAETLNVEKNNPITTAAETVGDVADAGVKTVTLQEIEE